MAEAPRLYAKQLLNGDLASLNFRGELRGYVIAVTELEVGVHEITFGQKKFQVEVGENEVVVDLGKMDVDLADRLIVSHPDDRYQKITALNLVDQGISELRINLDNVREGFPEDMSHIIMEFVGEGGADELEDELFVEETEGEMTTDLMVVLSTVAPELGIAVLANAIGRQKLQVLVQKHTSE